MGWVIQVMADTDLAEVPSASVCTLLLLWDILDTRFPPHLELGPSSKGMIWFEYSDSCCA